MKRILSIVLCFCILVSSVSCIAYAVDFNDITLEETISNVSELLEEQSDSGKAIRESAECRVIVKASRKPLSYGDFDFIECVDDIYIYQYDSLDVANKALGFYNNQSCVKWAELDGVVETNAEPTSAESLLQTNDIKAKVLENDKTLEKVVIAVVDTGISFTADYFKDRVVYDTGVNLSNSGQEGSAQDDNSHGTCVSAIICNNTNDNVEIYGYKVLNKDGSGTLTSLAYGIQAAIEDDVDIINLSLGGSNYSELVYEKVCEAKEKGIIILTASGNENVDVSTQYPASFDEVYTVGSIDKNGNRSFFSNYGDEVDFVSLGQDVNLSPFRLNGTSLACPAVSAVVAWVLSVAPTLTFDEVKQCLIDSCVSYESLTYHDGFHPISSYDVECTGDDSLANSVYEIEPDDESLYYGYGMPQIIPAVASALNKNTSIDTPKFSIESGTYNEEITVELIADNSNEIYYTTDESYPSRENGTKYSEPITITSSMSIRAVAYDENDLRSFPVACEYKMEFIPNESDFVIDDNGVISSYKGDLREMVIPETINGITVTGISPRVLSYMIGLNLPNSIKRIENMAFYQSKLKHLDAPGVEYVGSHAFSSSPLIYCNMPNLQVVGESAFTKTQLRELNFPELTTIGNFAFYQMPYLYSVSMPELESISYSAFQNCFQLRFADFPSVKTVEVNAFSECLFLKKINLPTAISFNNTQNDSMYGTFNQCQNLTEIDLPSATSLKGLCFKKCQYLEIVNLPNAVYIGNNTFYLCESLENITLEKAEYIGERAFHMANLSGDVTFPAVKEIANEAFCSTNITSLSLPNLEILGENAFADLLFSHTVNKKLEYLYMPNLKIAKDNAFAYTGALKLLELPNLVEIGKNAFIGSGVSRAEFSRLETTQSLPVVENSIIALPSSFKECTEDTKGRNYIIYGTEGTYAETWAEKNNHKFVILNSTNAILEDLPTEYYGLGEVLSPDVIGFNKTYQWYGYNDDANLVPTAIPNATNKEFNPADYDEEYKFYYCVVTSRDGNNEPIEIRTGITKNTTYGVCEHNYEAVITAPTCTENGYTTYTCSSCGDAYTSDETKALGHTEVMDNVVAPTCTETGLAEGKHCSVCNEVLVEQTVVNALGHTPKAPVVENVKDATCTENGGYDEVVYCSVCDEELSRETIIIESLGHTDDNDDGICEICNEQICSCRCHRTGIVKILWKILNFFQKFFGYNKVCACGKIH